MNDIEKEFIPHEQALALKELGFDKPCLAFFYGQRLEIGFNWINEGCRNSLLEETITAPTFSQAFRFFRDEYKLYSHVRESLGFDGTLEFVTQINGSYVNHGIFDKPANRFETYEEAELKCLIKLIEIVKNK
jgi:hypothetical protein